MAIPSTADILKSIKSAPKAAPTPGTVGVVPSHDQIVSQLKGTQPASQGQNIANAPHVPVVGAPADSPVLSTTPPPVMPAAKPVDALRAAFNSLSPDGPMDRITDAPKQATSTPTISAYQPTFLDNVKAAVSKMMPNWVSQAGKDLSEGLFGSGRQDIGEDGKLTVDNGAAGFFRPFGLGKSDIEKYYDRIDALKELGVDDRRATDIVGVVMKNGGANPLKLSQALKDRGLTLTDQERAAIAKVEGHEGIDAVLGTLDAEALVKPGTKVALKAFDAVKEVFGEAADKAITVSRNASVVPAGKTFNIVSDGGETVGRFKDQEQADAALAALKQAKQEGAITHYTNETIAAGQRGELAVFDADAIKKAADDFVPENGPAYSKGAVAGYKRALEEVPERDVVITAGGPASAKSEVITKTLRDTGQKGIVLEGTAASFDHTMQRVQEAYNAGKAPVVYGIIPDLKRSWQFAQLREAAGGQKLSLDAFLDRHVGAVNTLQKMVEAGVPVVLKDTRGVYSLDAARNLPFVSDPTKQLDILRELQYDKDNLKTLLENVKPTEKAQRAAATRAELNVRAKAGGAGGQGAPVSEPVEPGGAPSVRQQPDGGAGADRGGVDAATADTSTERNGQSPTGQDAPGDTAAHQEPTTSQEQKSPQSAGETPKSKPTAESLETSLDAEYNGQGGGSNKLPPFNPLEAGGKGGPEKAKKYGAFRKALDNVWTNVREFVDDNWYRVRKLVNDPEAKITGLDPYQAEILYHGRVGARVEDGFDFARDIDKDIVSSAKKLGIDNKDLTRDVNRYLIAQHAPERNTALLQPRAAGITTPEAKAELKAIEASPQGDEVKRIAGQILDFHSKTLDILKEGEVISDELYDTLRAKYKNHVPLNRIFAEDEDVGATLLGGGRALDVRSTGIKSAKGSDREVADILDNVVTSYEQAVIKAEKNRVDLSTLQFARDNKDLGVFQEIKPKALGREFPTAEQKLNGEEGRIIQERITDPQVLTLREKGKPVYLRIADPKLAAALRGINREKLPGLLRAVGTVSRFYSGLATRFNFEFAFSNKVRDLQELVVYLASKGDVGAAGATKTVLRDPASAKHIVDFLLGRDTEGARLYKQMRMDGGTTGGLGLATREQIELDLAKIRRLNRSNPRKAANAIIENIDKWNSVFEDSSRLSAYKTALDRGLTRDRAAVLAKEATVNFNKMGVGGPVVNAIYMFSNASIQGSVKMLRAMKNPKVAAAVITTVGAAVAATNQWNDHVDPDWRDKVAVWDRQNSLIVMLPSTDGGAHYITIPVSWGIKPIKVMMDYAYDGMAGKGQSAADIASGIFAAIANSYNPVGGTDAVSALTPTVLDTPVEIARNQKWTGSKIRPDWDKYAPGSIQYFDSQRDTATGQAFVTFAKGLSGIGIEMSPADMQYAYEQLIGGAGRSASKVVNTALGATNGDIQSNEVPVVSRFYRSVPQDQLGANSKQYQDVQKILTEQSRERFVFNQQAEDAFQQLKNLPSEEARKRFDELAKNDPDLSKKVAEIAKEDKKNLTYTDRLISQLGVDNGERARFIANQLRDLKSQDEKRALYQDYLDKKIISKAVAKQIAILLKK